jgi:hypothetical protein
LLKDSEFNKHARPILELPQITIDKLLASKADKKDTTSFATLVKSLVSPESGETSEDTTAFKESTIVVHPGFAYVRLLFEFPEDVLQQVKLESTRDACSQEEICREEKFGVRRTNA